MTDDPYAPPSAPLEPETSAAPAGAGAAGAEVVRRRGRRFLVTLYPLLAVVGGLVLISVLQLAMLAQGLPIVGEGDEFTPVEAFNGILILVWLLLLLTCGILWFFWIHRAYDNLRHIGAGFMRFSPGWAVGAWFVPILNLWRPYQVVADLWRRSTGGNRLEETVTPTPAWLRTWWLLWLLWSVAARAADKMYDAFPDSAPATGLYLVMYLTLFVGGLLVARIVRDVVRAQQQAFTGPADTADPLGGGPFGESLSVR